MTSRIYVPKSFNNISRNAIFLRRMHFCVNNMADPDITDYEFDADGLFRR
jgi:hypothetical protein